MSGPSTGPIDSLAERDVRKAAQMLLSGEHETYPWEYERCLE